MVLPGANSAAREKAEARTEADGDCTQQLADFILKELEYQHKLTELRKALHAVETFDAKVTFRRMGSETYGIDINSLRIYLERASCYLTENQSNGILRRFNHSGQGNLNWSEY